MIPVSIYKDRRRKLIQMLASEGFTSGAILLIAGFETEKRRFIQESSFWYLTGINEPGVVLLIDLDLGQTILFVPSFTIQRNTWTINHIDEISNNLSGWGIDRIETLGALHPSYHVSQFFCEEQYSVLKNYIEKVAQKDRVIYTIKPSYTNTCLDQQTVLFGLEKSLADLQRSLNDITPYIVQMRRIKDKYEIEAIFNAIDITVQAQEAVAFALGKGDCTEAEVQACAEYIITASGADVAFPSIVAGGISSTVLHYMSNSNRLKPNESVIVDIGAQKNHYCADLARMYPVAGKFSKRQKELYQVVLDAHLHVAQQAQAGYWLNNKQYPEQSLQHIAKAYFKTYGYEQYFTHGIGHMLGLDVHDCDDATLPLEVGAVFTIEPGLYLAQEATGIRIEDNYWLTQKGAISLSDHLAKEITDIERDMQSLP